MSWEAPLFLDTIDRFTLLSARPKFIFEIFGRIELTLHLNFINITVSFDVSPFRFTPFDIMLRMDTVHPRRYCTGMDYQVRTLISEVHLETAVNECDYGLIGGFLTNNDASDCFWRVYKPELPIYTLHF